MLFGNQPFIADMTAYAISNKSQTALKMRTDYQRRAKLICKKLANTKNIRPIMPKSGMFILIKLELKNFNDEKFAWNLLHSEGVAVMPGSSFGLNGKDFIRLSLTVPDKELERACERIDEFVKKID
jgi:arginine:pyruvate transaminase